MFPFSWNLYLASRGPDMFEGSMSGRQAGRVSVHNKGGGCIGLQVNGSCGVGGIVETV